MKNFVWCGAEALTHWLYRTVQTLHCKNRTKETCQVLCTCIVIYQLKELNTCLFFVIMNFYFCSIQFLYLKHSSTISVMWVIENVSLRLLTVKDKGVDRNPSPKKVYIPPETKVFPHSHYFFPYVACIKNPKLLEVELLHEVNLRRVFQQLDTVLFLESKASYSHF